MDQFVGRKYKLTDGDSKNFDEYMKVLGIGLLSRKTMTSLTPVALMTKNDDGSYVYSFITTLKTTKATFKLGEEFDEERADGTKVKSIITWEDGKLVHIQTDNTGKKSKHVRTYTMDKLIVETTVDGWDGKAVRVYEYQP